MKKIFLSAISIVAFTGVAAAAVTPDNVVEPMTTASDQFGWSVDRDGPYLVVGAPKDASSGNAAGAVHTYSAVADGNGGVNWTEEAVVYPPFHDAATDNMLFGYSVSSNSLFSNRPGVLVVGAPFYDHDGKTDSGAVFVYHYDDDVREWIYNHMITSPTGAEAYEWFGHSVAVYDDKLIVGSPQKNSSGIYDSGAAYVYDLVVSYRGMSYVYDFTLTDPNGIEPGGNFGYSADVTRTLYIVGAPGSDRSGASSGNAIVFDERNPGENWHNVEHHSIDAFTSLGYSVAAYNNHYAVGAPHADLGGLTNSGAVYIGKFDPENRSVSTPQVWTAFDGDTPMAESYAKFGYSVGIYAALHDDSFNVIAGAPQQNYAGTYGNYLNSGAAYLLLDDGSQQQYKMAYSTADLGDSRYLGRTVVMHTTDSFATLPSNGSSFSVQKVLHYEVPDPR